MFRNYLAAALRNLARNKFYSTINILGLAVGICAALLVSLIIRNELTYDQFIPGHERTYLFVGHNGTILNTPFTNPGFAALFKLKFPQIEATTRLTFDFQASLRHGQMEANEKIFWADPNFFDLLPLPVIAGNLKTALARPDGVVLTRSMARKYFNSDNPVGEQLQIVTQEDRAPGHVFPGGTYPMTVAAVIEDLPLNGTHLQSGIFALESGVFASGLASFSKLAHYGNAPPDPTGNLFVVQTYLRLAPNASIGPLQAAMPAFLPNYVRMPFSLDFVRLDRIHTFPALNPSIQNFLAMTALIGLLILFIACSNFVNLSTAHAARRALEVGVRKLSGAKRRTLIFQFIGEALVYVLLATILAIGMAELVLPSVNAALDSGAVLDYWRDPPLVAAIALGVIGVAVLAGLYPAFVLSAFRPMTVLKGWIHHSRASNALRQAIVAVQFAILIGLVVAAVVVYRQREYALSEALRVNTDQVLMVLVGSPATCNGALITELRALRGVRSAACTSMTRSMGLTNLQLKDGGTVLADSISVAPGMLEVLGLHPLAGQFFSSSTSQDEPKAVINETVARRLGYASPAAAIGQMYSAAVMANGPSTQREIIGVVSDFSLGTVEKPIDPTVYVINPNMFFIIGVKLAGRDIPETLSAIDRAWTATGGKGPIDRFFLDAYIQDLYQSVLREARGLAVFSSIAVLLACLGLIGLSVSTVERRTKEIGIRKAMGATVGDILHMLAWEFSKPVLWANLIAWPVAYYFMNRWLAGFAYHIDLAPWMFLAAGATALGIALATVSFQSVLVAHAKPVEALRYE